MMTGATRLPLEELRAIFASDEPPDSSRLRRLAIIITLQMADRAAAANAPECYGN